MNQETFVKYLFPDFTQEPFNLKRIMPQASACDVALYSSPTNLKTALLLCLKTLHFDSRKTPGVAPTLYR
jgi:hypothetical protein